MTKFDYVERELKDSADRLEENAKNITPASIESDDMLYTAALYRKAAKEIARLRSIQRGLQKRYSHARQ